MVGGSLWATVFKGKPDIMKNVFKEAGLMECVSNTKTV